MQEVLYFRLWMQNHRGDSHSHRAAFYQLDNPTQESTSLSSVARYWQSKVHLNASKHVISNIAQDKSTLRLRLSASLTMALYGLQSHIQIFKETAS